MLLGSCGVLRKKTARSCERSGEFVL